MIIPGHPDNPQLVVEYDFPDGIQTSKMIQPGLSYKGLQISCSLNDDEDGRLALKLMKKTFEEGKLFIIDTSINYLIDTIHDENAYQVVPFIKHLFREQKMNSIMTKLLIASIKSVA